MTLVVLEELVRARLVAVAIVVAGLTATVHDVRCRTGSIDSFDSSRSSQT